MDPWHGPFDANDNLIQVLGRLADLSVSQAAFDAAVAKYPEKRPVATLMTVPA